MTEQETVLLGQFSTPAAAPEPPPVTPLGLEVPLILFRRRKMVGAVSLTAACIFAGAVFLWQPSYVSQASILPPQQAQSTMAALASGALGGLTGSVGTQLGLKNPSDLYIGILKSRTIADAIIGKFDLRKIYKSKRQSDARRALSSKVAFASSKESLITISVTDHDPARAAALANAFVEELYKQNSRLALTGAAQKRLFFEQQLNSEKESLAKAEVDLKATQLATGLVVPKGQAEVLIRSGAELRAQIASREVELQAMSAYATEQNPQVETLKLEIAALEAESRRVETNQSGGAALEISGAKLPQASLEYVRRFREVQYHEALFELIAKQYEVARLDEAKDAPLIQIVDPAVIPDRPNRPSLTALFLGVIVAALLVGCLSPFAADALRKAFRGFQSALQASANA